MCENKLRIKAMLNDERIKINQVSHYMICHSVCIKTCIKNKFYFSSLLY